MLTWKWGGRCCWGCYNLNFKSSLTWFLALNWVSSKCLFIKYLYLNIFRTNDDPLLSLKFNSNDLKILIKFKMVSVTCLFKFYDIWLSFCRASGCSTWWPIELPEKLRITASQQNFPIYYIFAFVMTQTNFCAQQLLSAPDIYNMFASSELLPPWYLVLGAKIIPHRSTKAEDESRDR